MTIYLCKTADEQPKAQPVAQPVAETPAAQQPAATPAPAPAAPAQQPAKPASTTPVQQPAPAAPAANIPGKKFVPVVGGGYVDGNGQGGYTEDQVQGWWDRYNDEQITKLFGDKYKNDRQAGLAALAEAAKTNNNIWTRERAEQYIREGAEQGKRDLANNSGITSNIKGLGWLDFRNVVTGVAGGKGQVNNEWAAANAKSRVLTDNPFENARNKAYDDAINGKTQEYLYNQSRRSAAGAHIAGKALDGTAGSIVNMPLKLITGKDLTEHISGTSSDQWANEYEQDAKMAFGEEAGRLASQYLRTIGAGVEYIGAGATGVAMGGLTSGLQGAGIVGNSLYAMGNTMRTANAIAAAAHGVGQIASHGGQNPNFVSNIAGGVEGMYRIAPYMALGGGMISGAVNSPVMTNLSQWISSPGGNMVSRATKSTLGAIRGGFRGIGAASNWLSTPVAGGAVKRTLGNAGKWALRDMAMGVPVNVAQNVAIEASGGDANWNPTDNIGMATKPVVSLAGDVALSAVAGKDYVRNTTPDMPTEGKDKAALESIIDQNPESLEVVDAIQKANPDMPMAEVKELAKDTIATQAAAQNYDDALRRVGMELEPDNAEFWQNATEQEVQERYNSFDSKQRGESLYKHAMDRAGQGGYFPTQLFDSPDLSADQKKELLTQYLKSVDARVNDRSGAIGLLKQWWNKDEIPVDLMNKDKYARKVIVSYARSTFQSTLDNPNALHDAGADKQARDIIMNMTDAERREMLSPLKNATVNQVFNMQQAGGGMPELTKIGSDIIRERMQQDGNFFVDYVDKWQKAAGDGQGLGKADQKQFTEFITNFDPAQSLDNMDDEHFDRMTRMLMSSQGQDMLKDLPPEQQDAIKTKWEGAVKQKTFSQISKNPFKYMPMAVGLWMKSKGWDNAANIFGSPLGFYGSLLLLLGTGLWLGRGNTRDDNQEEVNNSEKGTASTADIMNIMRWQRQTSNGLA